MRKDIAALTIIITLSSIFFGWYGLVIKPRQDFAAVLLDKCFDSIEQKSFVNTAFATSQPEKTQILPWGCEWAADNYRKTGEWRF